MKKLSETLPGPRSPDTCQRCRFCAEPSEIHRKLTRWIEHDEHDRPTQTVIILCHPCADAEIEPHPRLYRLAEPAEPTLGALPPCLNCTYQLNLTCKHPDAKRNGGAGLALYPCPKPYHVCRTPRGQSGWHWFGKPITHCQGQDPFPF